MKSVLVSILVAAVLAGAGALIMVILFSTNPNSPNSVPGAPPGVGAATSAEDENPYADFQIPEFSLVDQNGQSVTHEALEGEVTVLDFFFTTCPGPCPGMTAQMQHIQSQTEGSGVRLMSISVDGDNDTPEVLRAYAQQASADPSRWTFLTGDPALVAEIVQQGLRFELSPTPDSPIYDANGAPRIGPSGKPLVNIVHPTRLFLVGPDRRLLGVFPYNNQDEVEALIERAKKAAG